MKWVIAVLMIGVGAFSAEVLPTVSVKSGSILFHPSKAKAYFVTHTGHDHDPALSPDEKWVTFVRDIPTKKDTLSPSSAVVSEVANELWVIGTDGKNPQRLVTYGKNQSYSVSMIHHPQFFPNNQDIAFEAALAVVEGGIYRVNRVTHQLHLITRGNSLEVIPVGKYKNYLIVQRHKYFLAGGSYDWYWLINPQGKEIDPIGEEDNVAMFKEVYCEAP
jgi:hypothetical protein